MTKHDFIWILLTGTAAMIVWFIHRFLQKKIRPRESAGRFFLYLILTLVSALLLIIVFGYLSIRYRLILFG